MNPYLELFAHIFMVCLAVVVVVAALVATIIIGFIIFVGAKWVIDWIAGKIG